MPRVRDHAKEYAALKARAQKAGLSTRGFRRARKAEPTKYYAPRAQVTLAKRGTLADRIAKAHQSRGENASAAAIQNHINHSTAKQRAQFDRAYKQWVRVGDDDVYDKFWLDDEDYDDLGFLLYYRD